MKKFLSLIVLCVLIACKSTQTELPALQNCPGEGDCVVQVFKETRLNLVETESKVSKVAFEEDSDFQVIFIQYTDSNRKGYSEEIYLQIPSMFKEIHSKNLSLKNQKVLLGKVCDCEEAGFEKITTGELKVIDNRDFISLHLEIKSQKTHKIKTLDINI
ncbi:hypothetical protein [Psychroflexus tropicus]|uniref:hypothetical protein n=1 Tax=Psychroflexus tropicus TaxID=197345 RepID=UPI00036362B1|nr:hypothetical protein [Psychroflexus tropicus]